MAWQKITKTAIKKRISKAGLGEAMAAWEILTKAKKYLAKTFGGKIEQEVKPCYVKNGSVVFKVSSSLWSRALKEKEKEILRYLKSPQIKRLRFIV